MLQYMSGRSRGGENYYTYINFVEVAHSHGYPRNPSSGNAKPKIQQNRSTPVSLQAKPATSGLILDMRRVRYRGQQRL